MTAPPSVQVPVPVREFTQRFRSSRLGARLARHRALVVLKQWGHPPDGDLAEAAGLVVGELAANAATHGRVRGRDFELRLVLTLSHLRIAVSDARGESRPAQDAGPAPDPLADSGRGLMLVAALAETWSVEDRCPVGKTVRADLALPKPEG